MAKERDATAGAGSLNEELFKLVMEVQEKCNAVNPPNYYAKYKELHDKYEEAKLIISSQNKELAQLRNALGHSDKMSVHSAGGASSVQQKLMDTARSVFSVNSIGRKLIPRRQTTSNVVSIPESDDIVDEETKDDSK
jgi:NADH dehydrogenase/NADH:ubiquinone oxidoreductase subunit G